MFCTNCGSEVNEKDKFCSNCGFRPNYNAGSKNKPEKKKMDTSTVIGLILLVGVILVGVGILIYLPIRKNKIIESYSREKILYDLNIHKEKLLDAVGLENYGDFTDIELVSYNVYYETGDNCVEVEFIAKFHQETCYVLMSNTMFYGVDDDYFSVNEYGDMLEDTQLIYKVEPFMSPGEIEEELRKLGYYSEYEITACDCIAGGIEEWGTILTYEEVESYEKVEYYVQFGKYNNGSGELERLFVQVYWNADKKDWDVSYSYDPQYCETDLGSKTYIPTTRYLTNEEKDKVCYLGRTIVGN